MRRSCLLIGAIFIALPAVASAQLEIATNDNTPVRATMVIRGDQGRLDPMPLVTERVSTVIDNQHARTTIKQTYLNRSNRVVEGRYQLDAGAGSRVEGFAYWNGEQKIVGEVFEKQAAREVYRRVTRRRRDPGLLEQTRDGAFAFRIFPIQAGEQKRVELSYSKWLARHGEQIRYRAPVASDGADIVVEIRSRLPVAAVRSPTHAIDVDKLRGGGVRVRARRGKAGAFELVYTLRQKPWSLATYVHKSPGHDGYFAVALAAPKIAAGKVAPKDVTIVLDRSGSMTGAAIDAAKKAAIDVVRRLGKGDRLNVISFDDDVDPLFDQPEEVSPAVRERAERFLDDLSAGGGTDLARALTAAFNNQDSGTNRPRIVLFFTDGQSRPAPAIAAARADRGDVRVFTVGLGTGVNKPLLARLARLKRGRYAYIARADEIERSVALVYSQISRPLLTDISFDITGAASDRKVYPRTLPDLFVDDELLITGRLRGESGIAMVTVRGVLDGKPVELRRELRLGSRMIRPWVGRQWARARVEHLIEDIALDGEVAEKKKEVIDLALAYNFVTDYTAFLAIPESELTADARAVLDRARADKADVMRRHADAAALARAKRAQPVPAAVRAADVDRDGIADEDDMGGDDDAADAPDQPVDRGEQMAVQSKRHGCAGCSSGGDGGLGGLVLALLALAAIGRRRRRAPVAGRRSAWRP